MKAESTKLKGKKTKLVPHVKSINNKTQMQNDTISKQ